MINCATNSVFSLSHRFHRIIVIMSGRSCPDCSVDHPCNKHSTCVFKGRLYSSKCQKCLAIYLKVLENPEVLLAEWWNSRIHLLSMSQKHRYKNKLVPVNIWGSFIERRAFGAFQHMTLSEAEPLIEEYFPDQRVISLIRDISNSKRNISKALSKLSALGTESSPASFIQPSSSPSSLWLNLESETLQALGETTPHDPTKEEGPKSTPFSYTAETPPPPPPRTTGRIERTLSSRGSKVIGVNI